MGLSLKRLPLIEPPQWLAALFPSVCVGCVCRKKRPSLFHIKVVISVTKIGVTL